jgi:hypothetical protein
MSSLPALFSRRDARVDPKSVHGTVVRRSSARGRCDVYSI